LVWWFLFKTKWGFAFRAVGANPNAARYAGMNIVRTTVLAMAYGFDAIAIALLGKNHPVGVVLSAILFGVLRTGATRMQVVTAIPIDIISVIQALILAFIAAPAIVRTLYRLRETPAAEQELVRSSWGS
jgi:simple sugar transport system permease protein